MAAACCSVWSQWARAASAGIVAAAVVAAAVVGAAAAADAAAGGTSVGVEISATCDCCSRAAPTWPVGVACSRL